MKTTVDCREIMLYDSNGIGAEFTNVVNGYLQNGFKFYYSESTRGTQGEEMSVNLTNDGGNTVYVVYLFWRSFGEFREHSSLEFIVERFEDAKNESLLWLGKGEVVSKKEFFSISGFRSRRVFVDNEDDFQSILKISKERRRRNHAGEDSSVLPLSANKTAFKILKKMKGFKTVTLKDIEYVVHKHGKCYAVKLVGQYNSINLIA